jgi:hypothetical protein
MFAVILLADMLAGLPQFLHSRVSDDFHMVADSSSGRGMILRRS